MLQSRGVVTLFHLFTIAIMEGIVLISSIDLYCVTGIFNGTGDMLKR